MIYFIARYVIAKFLYKFPSSVSYIFYMFFLLYRKYFGAFKYILKYFFIKCLILIFIFKSFL